MSDGYLQILRITIPNPEVLLGGAPDMRRIQETRKTDRILKEDEEICMIMSMLIGTIQ
jgi:hypothetical protein